RPISRRDFVKTGIAVGGVAGASVVVAGRTNLQALQVGQAAGAATVSDPFASRTVTLNVNGKDHMVSIEPRSMLVDVLRDAMGLVATKRPCNRNSCGACTVLIDEQPVEACSYMAIRAVGHSIMTAEVGAGDPVVSALDQAYVVSDGGQCAFCGPGMVMTAAALLKQNNNPSVADIKAALSGNVCRCGNYMHIIDAVTLAARNLRGGS
ncbi:MAG: (2Fe-2S)-binding protein, partial [Nitrososphaerota archaeon]|nr:(2Fe-2S)-binding protein [Nitrososphaerota archaeon]